jgi:hypothetical protein
VIVALDAVPPCSGKLHAGDGLGDGEGVAVGDGVRAGDGVGVGDGVVVCVGVAVALPALGPEEPQATSRIKIAINAVTRM